MKPATWSIPAIVMGLALAFLGPLVAGWVVPVESLWSDTDAEAKSKAAAELHAALHDHAGHDHAGHDHTGHKHVEQSRVGQVQDAAADTDRLVAAQAEVDRQQARLDGVVASHGWLLFAVRMLGVLIAGAGVTGAIFARQS